MRSARAIAVLAFVAGAACAAAAATAAVAVAAAGEAPAVQVVVTSGQPAPGGGSFERFTVESQPIVAPVNSRGQVAFFATLLRGAASEGLFLASGGRIAKVVLEGDVAPGGGTISGLGRHPLPALNATGTVAFAAAVTGGKTVEGIFTATQGRLRAVAVAGGSAPGIASGTFATLEAPSVNDRGDVVFLASVRRGRETMEAIYLHATGKLIKLVAQGDPAPAGGSFAAFGFPTLNNKGAVAFGAVVEGPAVPGGIFVGERGAVRMVVGAGEETPVGGIFAKLSERVGFNDAGTVAFHAFLKNGPVPAGVFSIDGPRRSKVAAIGDAAPGGGTLSHFGLWPALDRSGAVGFAASVDGGPGGVAVFVADATAARRLAGVGDALSGGARLATLTLYPLVAMSPSGAITFAATVSASASEAGAALSTGSEGIYLIRAR